MRKTKSSEWDSLFLTGQTAYELFPPYPPMMIREIEFLKHVCGGKKKNSRWRWGGGVMPKIVVMFTIIFEN
jgi:hypothetical protein